MCDGDTGTMEPDALPSIYGQCTCCLKEDLVKNMVEQMSSGEVITRMFLLCYGLEILEADIGDRKPSICSVCENRLRDALEFRHQVENALEALKEHSTMTAYITDENGQADTKEDNKQPAEDMDHGDIDDVAMPDLCAVKCEEPDSDDDLMLSAYKQKSYNKLDRSSRKKSLESWIACAEDRSKRKRSLIDAPNYPTVDEMTEFISSGLFPLKSLRRNRYECLICKKKFKNLIALGDHWTDHSEKKEYKIKAIKKMIRLNLSWQFEVVGARLKCKLCLELISDLSSMYKHEKECTKINKSAWKEPEIPYKLEKNQRDCPECKQIFINTMTLKQHMNTHFPNFMCEICGKAFATKSRLRGHSRVHVKGEFACKVCSKVFDKVSKRENHMAYAHKPGSRYVCPRCGVPVSSFYARQKHLAEAHDERLKRYECSVCPKSYITPGHLSSHVRRDHLNERNHKCDKCEQAFYTKHSLSMHMISHDGQRIHSCQLCGKSYQRVKTLREHMRIHNNDKRFVCPLCGRAFTQKCTLNSHLRTHERTQIV